MPEAPRPPEWVERELKVIDPWLCLEWDHDREAFYLMSRRGSEVVPYGLFAMNDLHQKFLDAVRAGIQKRDQGVSVKQRMAEMKEARDRKERAQRRELSEFFEAQATREADASNVAFKTYEIGRASCRERV